MKIALVCTGLGRVRRGYERFTRDLFELLKDDLDITLFKGGGPASARERALPHLRHDGILSKLPHFQRDAYFYPQLSYAFFLLPALLINRYDIVHFSEPGLGNILYHIKKRFGLKFKSVFSNGVGIQPKHCMRADHLHQLTPLFYDQAVEHGISREKVTCLPYGVYADRFVPSRNKKILRKEYEIPADKILVLSVAAINRTHKRIDCLIREIAKLDDRFFLLVCGNMEDPSLIGLARSLLPGRHRFMNVSFDVIPRLYNMADIFVHTALEEGFCLALVEAMLAKLPVLCHHAPHFQWLVEFGDSLVDMAQPGHLATRLEASAKNLPEMELLLERRQTSTRERFDWHRLKPEYIKLYEQTMSPDPSAARTR